MTLQVGKLISSWCSGLVQCRTILFAQWYNKSPIKYFFDPSHAEFPKQMKIGNSNRNDKTFPGNNNSSSGVTKNPSLLSERRVWPVPSRIRPVPFQGPGTKRHHDPRQAQTRSSYRPPFPFPKLLRLPASSCNPPFCIKFSLTPKSIQEPRLA